MPFLTQDRRDALDTGGNPQSPGDRCYRWYREYKALWNQDPRWTRLAHIYHLVKTTAYVSEEEKEAAELAWQVFMGFVGFPYEEQKMEENGDIE